MGIAENIRHLRLLHDLSQKDFGKIAGVSDKAVSAWENGLKEPRMGAIQKIADHFGLQKSNIIENNGLDLNAIAPSISSTPSEPEYTEEEKGIVRGYRKAPDNLKQVVKLTLQPYMVEATAVAIPEKVEAVSVAVAIPEKAKIIIDFLKPFGIDCEYWDEAPDGESGDFIAMTILLTKFQGKDGYPHSSNKCWQYLEGLYKELKPAMDASDAERKKLIDKFIADTFQRDIAIAEGLSYRDKSTLLNVSKEVASKYHGVIDEDGNPRLERIKSKETPADSKPADKKEAEG